MKQLKLFALLLTFACAACTGSTTPTNSSDTPSDVEISVPSTPTGQEPETSADPSDSNVATEAGENENEDAPNNPDGGTTQEENEAEETGLSTAQTMAVIQQVLFSKHIN